MRAREAVSMWFVPKLVVALLGAAAICCGCGDYSGVLGPGSGLDGGDDSTAGTDDPSPADDVLGFIDIDDDVDPPLPEPVLLEPLPPLPEPELAEPLPPLPQPELAEPLPPLPEPELVEPVDGGGGGGCGQHLGERKQLEVEITFSQEFGETVTDSSGTHYYFNGIVIDEDKVYPEEYWGTYPLYFFGTTVGVTVRITNPGPRRKVKVRVRTEAYCLLTDGSNGAQLAPLQEVDLEVARGQTVTLDTSFTPQYDPDADGMEGGLDRFIVKVYHVNAGGGKNGDAGLIMAKEGVFCPPELEGDS